VLMRARNPKWRWLLSHKYRCNVLPAGWFSRDCGILFRLDETTYISRTLSISECSTWKWTRSWRGHLRDFGPPPPELPPTRHGLGNISASAAEHFVRCALSIGSKQHIGSDQFSLSICRRKTLNMVCSKCQKVLKKTELATPGVKRKNEIYPGSPTAEKSETRTNGISKVGLLERRNPASTSLANIKSLTEQTPKQRCKEPLCRVLKLM
jgi:cysteine-rich PDZ-binding protein